MLGEATPSTCGGGCEFVERGEAWCEGSGGVWSRFEFSDRASASLARKRPAFWKRNLALQLPRYLEDLAVAVTPSWKLIENRKLASQSLLEPTLSNPLWPLVTGTSLLREFGEFLRVSQK